MNWLDALFGRKSRQGHPSADNSTSVAVDSGDRKIGESSRPLRRWPILLATVLLLASTLERLTVPVGPAHVYVAHFLAFLCIPFLGGSDRAVRLVRNSMLVFAGLSAILLMPSVVFLPDWHDRVLPLGQLILNSLVLAVGFALFRRCTDQEFRVLLRVITVALLVACVAQIAAFNGGLTTYGTRILGIPRPNLFFIEPTWTAAFAALLFISTVTMCERWLAAALATIVLIVLSRGAVLIAGVTIFGLFLPRRRTRPLVMGIIFFELLVGAGFVFKDFSTNQVSTTSTSNSVQSRYLYSYVVRLANDQDFWPLGGRVLKIHVPHYEQVSIAVSNVAGFDFIWKFGIPGILVFAGWFWFVGWNLPRLMAPDWQDRRVATAGQLGLSGLAVSMQFNNAFGRPWLWLTIALALDSVRRAGRGSTSVPTTGLAVGGDPSTQPSRHNDGEGGSGAGRPVSTRPE